MDVEDFTPLAFAATDDGDVLTVVRYAARSRETGKLAKMDLHHWFRFTNGKISYYRGTEDTAITAAALVTPLGPARRAIRCGACRLGAASDAGVRLRLVGAAWLVARRRASRARRAVVGDRRRGDDRRRRRADDGRVAGAGRPDGAGHARPGSCRRTREQLAVPRARAPRRVRERPEGHGAGRPRDRHRRIPRVHEFPDIGGATGYGGIDPPCSSPCISPLHTHDVTGDHPHRVVDAEVQHARPAVHRVGREARHELRRHVLQAGDEDRDLCERASRSPVTRARSRCRTSRRSRS